jgi:PAS domain S-box-containing protein/diguanylate cyclase (GGDEF)-like protein
MTAPKIPPDVTDGRDTQERRTPREVRKDYRRLLEASPGLVCFHDLDGRLSQINPAGAEALGYRPEMLVGRHLREVVDEEFHPHLAEYLETVAREGEASGVMRVRHRDGHLQLWAYANRRIDGGDTVIGHAHDVTELYEARRELRRLSEEDATTRLPTRRVFVRRLHQTLDTALERGSSLSMALLNPVSFREVNDQFGRPAGDQVLAEISQRLRQVPGLEPHHFGGATFAFILPSTGAAAVRVGETLIELLENAPYLDSSLRLSFNVGLAPFAPSMGNDPIALEVLLSRRAGWALEQAHAAGGGVMVASAATDQDAPRRHLSGIFTTDLATDFRNMQLMWEVLDILGQATDPEEIGSRLLDALCSNLGFRRAGLQASAPGDEAAWRVEHPPLADPPFWTDGLTAAIASVGDEPVETPSTDDSDVCWWLLPLSARERRLAVLVLETARSLRQDRARLLVVDALAGSIAAALDRATLLRQEILLQQYQSEVLEQEVEDLRQVVQRSHMVFESPVMNRLVDRARRVADNDVPVLVTGESGTGKEVFAQFLHDLGPRRAREAQVVDLSTLSPSVIESELFGHRKGAFTGADQDAVGRLAQAEGGSVILDEIGELPLELQAKLLRFVQEREVVAVGDHRVRRIDTRIIACTNRDLGAEVEAGRFRMDLFHRLNVLRFHLPPLRDRRDDIPALAESFLSEFARQYDRRRTLSPEAREGLLSYRWPGNIRELKNRLLRAVLTSQGPQIAVEDFDLPAELSPTASTTSAVSPIVSAALAAPMSDLGGRLLDLRDGPGAPHPPLERHPQLREEPSADPWRLLDRALVGALDAALHGPGPLPPLLDWLLADLLWRAVEAADGGGNTAAQLLDIPETTLRRRRALLPEVAPRRPPYWPPVVHALENVLVQGGPGSQLHDRVQASFVERLASELDDDPRRAASLAGVSPSTWRRWRRG